MEDNKLLEDSYRKLKSILYSANCYIFNMQEVKEIMENIIKAGNSYILDDPYLYCFSYIANDYSNSSVVLVERLKQFETNDLSHLVSSISDLYADIFHFNDIGFYNNKIKDLRELYYNNGIPLLQELEELCDEIDKLLNTNDYFLVKEIFFLVLGYCIATNKQDSYLNYCKEYLSNPDGIIDELIMNGIVFNINNNEPVIDTYKLRDYIILKLNNRYTKKIEVK